MAHFLFIDESGYDERESPYCVLAGIAVKDSKVWQFIEAINKLENNIFGMRYSAEKEEFKGKKFLKKKVFRHAEQFPPIDPEERRTLAFDCLKNGAGATRRQLCALAQAKLEFLSQIFSIAADFQCHAFSAIVIPGAPKPDSDALRKDYSYLFERFYYYLEDLGVEEQGVIVFDELDKSQSKILLNQMERYFVETARGRVRARQVIPQPFFVHSDLTTLVQVADLIAYTTSWAWRLPKMAAPARGELGPFANQIDALRYKAERYIRGNPKFSIWSFAYIADLRCAAERSPLVDLDPETEEC
ncbi:DUF3800 domain-containing protein [Xanthomonas hortorum]|uniref:DUF3800 domain-containing protein n=1 Tax=Xanthomonas hortorum TaxID=56454 RepID=UPI001E4AE521|nr:DUF3800 domain-containing protein [Xanthomonas hortorum]MCC8555425.1 DUF3800 domain-containing protein [Xanthomonas hortorum pv. gardneri]